ncbi:hypothetical protein IH981_02090 [Patescibacteria group bacterium]|nr:hypothetical protein [Patescibacteria group bacterium]
MKLTIKESAKMFRGRWKFTIRDAKTGKIKRVYEYENLIPTVGRSLMAEALSGGLAAIADIEINKTALGTGVTAPANGDTKLETEVFRKDVASATFSSNKLFITAFYTAGEVSGTFAEAGLFIKGLAGADTGTLFSRVSISITKSSSETLTIDTETDII